MSIPILHAVDTVSKKCSTGDNTVTRSFTVDNVAGRVLKISVDINSSAPGAVAVLSATFGAQPLAIVGAGADTGKARIEVWSLIDPGVGTETVTVTITDPPGGTTRAVVVGISFYKNANQTAPFVILRGLTKQGVANPYLTINSMDEELVDVSISHQEDLILTAVANQDARWDGTQAGDSGAETIMARGATKVGEASTLVGWTGTGVGNLDFAMFAIPICGPDVSMEGRGSTSNQATGAMSLLIPLEVAAIGSAIGSALVTAANWLQALATGQAKATVTLTESTFLQAFATGQAIAGARVETDARLFVLNGRVVVVPFEVNLAAHGSRDDGVAFQSSENGVILRFTVKNGGVVVSLAGATVWLYVSGHAFSPFPVSITDAANGVGEYIVGAADFEAGEYRGEIDVLLPTANQYRSATFPITVLEAVA